MEAVIYSINPDARVIHLMHGISGFDLFTAARTMETVYYMPVGYHVCVVDPGVGTRRKAIAVRAKRGDYFVGPDNGCLMTAPRLLGGIDKVVEISNEKYMIRPVSPIFHGRHIFAPVAAHLSLGVPIESLGRELSPKTCVKAPYEEATVEDKRIAATAIHVNHFGSVHLNILHEEWDRLGVDPGKKVRLTVGRKSFELPFVTTFGDVAKAKPLIMKDDYKRVEVAINMGSFVKKHRLNVGDRVYIQKM
jgi:S-adenosylmethionine hydrolase